MKKPLYRFLSYLCIIAFLGYWVSLFFCAMPSNYAKKIILNKAPRFKSAFGASWKLFSPPATYNHRLYFISTDVARPNIADTIEVLENISFQKQRHVPFNQRENIIDHLVNNSVLTIGRVVWYKKKMPESIWPGAGDTLLMANAIAAVNYNDRYKRALSTLQNYGNIILKQKNINTSGKEIKICITKAMMRPYSQKDNTEFLPRQTIVFETSYKPAIQ